MGRPVVSNFAVLYPRLPMAGFVSGRLLLRYLVPLVLTVMVLPCHSAMIRTSYERHYLITGVPNTYVHGTAKYELFYNIILESVNETTYFVQQCMILLKRAIVVIILSLVYHIQVLLRKLRWLGIIILFHEWAFGSDHWCSFMGISLIKFLDPGPMLYQ